MTLVRSPDKLKYGNTQFPVFCGDHTTPAVNRWLATDFTTGNLGDTATDNATLEVVQGSATIDNSPDSCSDALVPPGASTFAVETQSQVINFSKPWGIRKTIGTGLSHVCEFITRRDGGGSWGDSDARGEAQINTGFGFASWPTPSEAALLVSGYVGASNCRVSIGQNVSAGTRISFGVGSQCCVEVTLSCAPCDNRLRLRLRLISALDVANNSYVGWWEGLGGTTLHASSEIVADWDGEELVIDDGSTTTYTDNIKYKFPTLIQGWSDEQRLRFQHTTAFLGAPKSIGLQELRTFDTFV